MTPQEIYDTVINHLRAQGQRAMGTVGCAYRGAGGTKCAVGVLIPDELYDPAIEGRSVTAFKPGTVSVDATNRKECDALGEAMPLLVEHNVLLGELQSLHDAEENWNPNGFADRGEWIARDIARSFNLVYTRRT